MGEKEGKRDDKEKKPEGEKKKEGGDGGKKDDGMIIVVMKVEMHCEGCASKVKRSVKGFEGVDSVSADLSTNKLTVVGKVDPWTIRDRVESKTRKKVDLVSPANAPKPKEKDGGGGGDSKDQKKKAEEKKPKTPSESTVVLKIRLHCEGCIQRIRKTVYKMKVFRRGDSGVGRRREGSCHRERHDGRQGASGDPQGEVQSERGGCSAEKGRRRREEGRWRWRWRRRWREEGRWRRRWREERRRRWGSEEGGSGREVSGAASSAGNGDGGEQDGAVHDVRGPTRVRARALQLRGPNCVPARALQLRGATCVRARARALQLPHGDGARAADVQR